MAWINGSLNCVQSRSCHLPYVERLPFPDVLAGILASRHLIKRLHPLSCEVKSSIRFDVLVSFSRLSKFTARAKLSLVVLSMAAAIDMNTVIVPALAKSLKPCTTVGFAYEFAIFCIVHRVLLPISSGRETRHGKPKVYTRVDTSKLLTGLTVMPNFEHAITTLVFF